MYHRGRGEEHSAAKFFKWSRGWSTLEDLSYVNEDRECLDEFLPVLATRLGANLWHLSVSCCSPVPSTACALPAFNCLPQFERREELHVLLAPKFGAAGGPFIISDLERLLKPLAAWPLGDLQRSCLRNVTVNLSDVERLMPPGERGRAKEQLQKLAADVAARGKVRLDFKMY